MIEVGEARQHGVGHQPVRVERRDAPLLHDADESSHSVSLNCRRGAMVLSVVSMSNASRGRAGRRRLGQRGPAAKAGVLRDKRLRLDQLEIVPGDS